MKKTPIERTDFNTSLEERLSETSTEEMRILEDYTDQLDDLNKLSLGWSEDYTDVVNLEDELANIKANFVNIEGYNTLLGGTPVKFVKEGKTYKPQLGGIEIKGMLKRKLVAHLTHAVTPKVVDINGTPAVKYTVQYSTYALEIYVFKNGNSFFKAFMSAKQDKKKQTIKYGNTYNQGGDVEVDGNMFPEVELAMVDNAQELLEELQALVAKSASVKAMLKARQIYI